ncbi:hypothetical protein [Reyranella sp.]|uniref:hypothetical protein n=1 Tax=Reyranella sp. TaxID=1929291 RepID=UPI003BAD13CE
MGRITLTVAVAVLAATSVAACHDQHTIEGTRSHTLTVGGKRMKANLSPTGGANEFDLLVVRDDIVINPDPASERERGQEAASRIMGEVCKVKGLKPQVLDDRLVQQLNYYVRFRCV